MTDAHERYTALIIAALNLQQTRLYNDTHPGSPHADEDEEMAEIGVWEAASELLRNVPQPAFIIEDEPAATATSEVTP